MEECASDTVITVKPSANNLGVERLGVALCSVALTTDTVKALEFAETY